ncbi:hypothetical protein [Wolbachia endosymbiont of Chironomus riparius]|nr:hypothetical protein [Wolbachia endosymbiont of Chironomus riparius]
MSEIILKQNEYKVRNKREAIVPPEEIKSLQTLEDPLEGPVINSELPEG